MPDAVRFIQALRSLALVGLIVAPGCKDNPIVGEIAAIADKVCSCKDFECAEGVQQEAIEYSKKHRSTMVSKEDNRAVAASMAKAKACLDALAPKKEEPLSDAAPPRELAPPQAMPAAAEPAPIGLEARPAEDESPSR